MKASSVDNGKLACLAWSVN